MADVTWLEAETACNNIFYTYCSNHKVDYVAVCCNGCLPQALTHMLAEAMFCGLTKDDEDVVVMVNAYSQLRQKGYVGSDKD
jgi:hypothetical protein